VSNLMVRLITRLLRGETILFLALVMLALPSGASANAQGSLHRAGLVVRFGNGSVISRCVAFSEPSLTGLELLSRAGLSIVVDLNSSIGAGVCKIGSEGCDRGRSCFCQCEGSTCAYWQYFHLQSGAWKYSNVGAASYQVSDGAVEGWAWGNNVAPPPIGLDQICATGGVSMAATSASAQPSPSSTVVPRPATPTAAAATAPITASAVPTAASATARALTFASATLPPAQTPPSRPTLAPMSSQTLALEATVPAQNAGNSPSFTSYAIFGIIVLGLGVWLVTQLWRKAR
jgi:hypothetical protein